MSARPQLAALLALGLLSLPSAAGAQQLSVPAPGSGDYRILVTGVDSSEFPRIKLRFKVIIQGANTQKWHPDMGVKIIEDVQLTKDGQPQLDRAEGKLLGPPELCEVQPVALGMAVDVSGSVTPVMQEIQAGASQVFQEMYSESQEYQVRDVGALYAFSSDKQHRFPLPGGGGAAPPTGQPALGTTTSLPTAGGGGELYTGDQGLIQLSEVSKQIPAGGASPIWNAMKNEAELLSQHDPQNRDLQRVLVTLTDGQDNQSTQADVNRLLYLAQQTGITLVNLGYGETNDFGLATVAQATGGVYVAGIEGNIEQILLALLDGMRKTYCIEYISPHPHLVNEPALVNVTTGNSNGQGVFPLPFVIPEDSQNVKLFVPVTEFMYKGLAAGQDFSSQPVFAKTTAALVNADGSAWAPAKTDTGAEGPGRGVTSFEFFATEWSEGTEGDPLSGWGFFLSSPKQEWQDMYKVPTDQVDLEAEPGSEVVTGVNHWVLATNLEENQADGSSRASRNYPVKIRLSVQDRTPPHVFVRARPQDGGAQMELRVLPQAVDEDTMILHVNDANVITSQGTLSSFSRPSYHMAQTPGSGNKLARLVYSWRDEEGQPVTGDVPGQLWGLWDAERNPVFKTEDAMAGTQSQAISGTEHGIFTEGITVRAGSRMFLEVAARDNYALLEQSGLAEDAESLTNPAVQVDVPGGEPRVEPRHAAFDLGQAEAEPFAEKAPYLPFMELEEQQKEENRMKPGVTWWIESKDERDRYAGIEGIREVHYQLPDSAIAPGLGQMVLSGGQPIRVLKVRAQDGQGNFTVLDLPLRVVPNGFRARTLDWQSRRGGEVLD